MAELVDLAEGAVQLVFDDILAGLGAHVEPDRQRYLRSALGKFDIVAKGHGDDLRSASRQHRYDEADRGDDA